MKVFISWSGKLSGDVALLLNEWLPSAVPGTVPWLSKDGIEKGSIWFGAIEEALKETSVGVICLTRENKNRPWILFEAGGLNKGLDKSRVCPLLLDLEDKELDPPLNQFHTTKLNKKDMLALCMTINRQNTGHAYSEQQLEKFFKKFWPEFESKLAALLKKHRASRPPKKKEVPEMLEQILEAVQAVLRNSQTTPYLPEFLVSPPRPLRYPGFGNLGALGVYPPLTPQPSAPFSATELEGLDYDVHGKEPSSSAAEALKPKPSAAEALKPKPSTEEVLPNRPPAA